MTAAARQAGEGERVVDRRSHNELYGADNRALPGNDSCREFQAWYETEHMSPFCEGGTTKGYVRGLATRRLLESALDIPGSQADVRILDAGCGRGELSLYLACRGLTVIGVDVSEVGCNRGRQWANRLGVGARCHFITGDLASLPLSGASIDFVIGHASLHHFIKYPGVSGELYRIMKPGATGFFADSFGENPAYRLFHDEERMKRLGDVPLNRKLIEEFFRRFRVRFRPTDWFVMFDKLYSRLTPDWMEPALRKLSRLHFELDRLVPVSTGLALRLSGSVLTEIQKPNLP